MSNEKISEYANSVATAQDTDLMDMSVDIGGTPESRKFPWSVLRSQVDNLATIDLVSLGNRTFDMDGNTLTFNNGGVFNIDSALVVNDAGASVDTRIEGFSDANLLFVDASEDMVGIGTNAPAQLLDVRGNLIAGSGGSFFYDDGVHQLLIVGDTNSNTISGNLNRTMRIRSLDNSELFEIYNGGQIYLSRGGNSIGFLSINGGNAGSHLAIKTEDDLSGGRSFSINNSVGDFVNMRNNGVITFGNAVPGSFVGIGRGFNNSVGADTLLELQDDLDITGNETDEFSATLTFNPVYSANSASSFTIDRHNYIDVITVGAVNDGAGDLTVTDAAVMRFNAAPGSHSAIDSGTTKTSPGTVDAWRKDNIDGTIYYTPMYTSKTT